MISIGGFEIPSNFPLTIGLTNLIGPRFRAAPNFLRDRKTFPYVSASVWATGLYRALAGGFGTGEAVERYTGSVRYYFSGNLPGGAIQFERISFQGLIGRNGRILESCSVWSRLGQNPES